MSEIDGDSEHTNSVMDDSSVNGEHSEMDANAIAAEYEKYRDMLNHANSSKQVVQAFTGTNALVTGTPLFAFAGGEVWIGDTRGQVERDKNPVRSLMIVDDEVWAGYCTGDIVVWDRKTGVPLKEIPGHGKEILALLHCKGTVWIGSNDWEVKVRNRQTGSLLKVLPDGHRDWVRSLLEVGGHVWSTGDDRICIWDGEFGDKLSTIEVKAKVRCICRVGDNVWAGCADGIVRIFSREGKYLSKFAAHKNEITGIVCVGSHVWTGSVDKLVKIWDRNTQKLVEGIDFGYPVAALALVGTQVWVGGRGMIKVHPANGITDWLVHHVDALAQQLAIVTKEREELEHKVNECNIIMNKNEEELRERQAAYAKMEDSNSTAAQNLERKVKEQEDIINSNQRDCSSKLEHKDSEIAEQIKKIGELEKDTQDKKEWIAKMEAEKNGMDDEIANIKKQLATAQAEKEALEREFQEHTKECQANIEKLKQHEADITDRDNEILALKNEKDQMGLRNESETRLKQALADMEKRFAQKNTELEVKEKELAKRAKELADHEVLSIALKEKLDTVTEEKQGKIADFSNKLQKMEHLCKEHGEERAKLAEQNRALVEATKKLEEELVLNKDLPNKLKNMELEISRLQTEVAGPCEHEQFVEQLQKLENRAGSVIGAEDAWQSRLQEYNKIVAQAHTAVDSIHTTTLRGSKRDSLTKPLCVFFLCFVLLLLICFILLHMRLDPRIGLRRVPWPN